MLSSAQETEKSVELRSTRQPRAAVSTCSSSWHLLQVPPVLSHPNLYQQGHRQADEHSPSDRAPGPAWSRLRSPVLRTPVRRAPVVSCGTFRPRSRRAASIRIIAILIRSAAVPCNGVFTAVRSAKPRWFVFLLLMSGIGRTRPNSVVTFCSRRASSSVLSMNARTPLYFSK